MTRRVIRTTKRIQRVDDAEPVETIHEREVDRVIQNDDGLQVYEEEILPEAYTPEPVVRASSNELTVLNSWLRTFSNISHRQFSILRDFDARLARLEDANRVRQTPPSFERATWWALWGILMLILGAALVVIIILILGSLIH